MRRLIIGMTGSTGAIFGVRMLRGAQERHQIPPHHLEVGWHARARNALHRRAGPRPRQRRAQPGRHGRVDLVRLVQDRGHGGDPMLGARARRHRQRLYGEHLVHRAADVVLKERRRLVLVVRETPLSGASREHAQAHAHGHLDRAADAGLLQSPADGGRHRQSHHVARVLDQFDIAAPFAKRWDGHMHTATKIATVAPSSSAAARHVSSP